MRNNIKTMLLAGAITASSAVIAYGASTMPLNDGSIDTYSNLEIADINIPSNIDISMQDGLLVDNSSNYSIVNNSKFGIQISDIVVTGKNGWTAISYDEPILSKEKNTKELTLEINGDKLSNNGNISLTEENWLISSMDSKNLDINIKIPSQDSIDKTSAIAAIEYTIETQKNTITYTAGQNGRITGILRNDIEFSNGDNLILPDTIPDDGYVFDKWINSLTGETVTEDTTVKSDMVLEAQFKLKETAYIDKTSMDSVLKSLTGSITFVSEPYTGPIDSNVYDISTTQDNQILAVVNGENATVYSDGGAKPTTGKNLFSGYSVNSMDLKGLDTSQLTNMSWMFYNCSSLQSLDLSSFDTSQVTNMSYMFQRCESLQYIVLSKFNTSKVTDMSGMFSSCESLQSLDLSNFNTAQVTKMYAMFIGCRILKSLDLSSFDTSQVTNMSSMFFTCNSLQSLDLSNFNTSRVTTMSSMFSDCSANPIYVSSTTYDWFTSNFPENNFVEAPADQHTGGGSGNSN